MENKQEGEYTYSVEPGCAGAGMRVWRWSIRRGDDHPPVHQGTSIRSREDAMAAALQVIRRLKPASGPRST
jgi:hypothetical protein